MDFSTSAILFRRIDRSDEHTANDAAVVKKRFHGFFRNNICFLRYFDPIFCFIAFFQGDLQFCDEVGSSVSVFCLTDIRADACTAPFKLICKGIVPFNAVGEFQNLNRKFG